MEEGKTSQNVQPLAGITPPWFKFMSRVLVLLGMGSGAFAQTSAEGRWHAMSDSTGAPRALIEVRVTQGELEAVVVKVFGQPGEYPHPTCVRCTDERRNRPIEGMTIVRGLKSQGPRVWSGGEILSPETGKTYDCMVELSDDGQELKVRGYRKFLALGKTQIWKKVQ